MNDRQIIRDEILRRMLEDYNSGDSEIDSIAQGVCASLIEWIDLLKKWSTLTQRFVLVLAVNLSPNGAEKPKVNKRHQAGEDAPKFGCKQRIKHSANIRKRFDMAIYIPDKDFFKWIYDRLVFVHGENPDIDYMRSLKERIDKLPTSKKWLALTPNAAS